MPMFSFRLAATVTPTLLIGAARHAHPTRLSCSVFARTQRRGQRARARASRVLVAMIVAMAMAVVVVVLLGGEQRGVVPVAGAPQVGEGVAPRRVEVQVDVHALAEPLLKPCEMQRGAAPSSSCDMRCARGDEAPAALAGSCVKRSASLRDVCRA